MRLPWDPAVCAPDAVFRRIAEPMADASAFMRWQSHFEE